MNVRKAFQISASKMQTVIIIATKLLPRSQARVPLSVARKNAEGLPHVRDVEGRKVAERT